MSAPEKCPKCGCSQFVDITSGREFICFTLIAKDETLYEGNQCLKTQRDQLAERVRELEAWKESAMAVERQWDPNQLAAMLGGQPGEPQRAVIQWKVPVLVQRVKRLEEAGDKLIDAIYSAQCWNGTYVGECVDEFESAKSHP